MPVFKLVSKLKALRGTRLDLFGYTQERKAERQLIQDYLALLGEIKMKLNENNFELGSQLVALPEGIRGFGHVKEKNLNSVRGTWNLLVTQLNASGA